MYRSSSPISDKTTEVEYDESPSESEGRASSQLKLQSLEEVGPTGCSQRALQVVKTIADSKRTFAPPPAKRCRQYFLDLGQADFTHTTCRVCGLVYARGLESDEKLHSSFHRSQLKGIHYKVNLRSSAAKWLRRETVAPFNLCQSCGIISSMFLLQLINKVFSSAPIPL